MDFEKELTNASTKHEPTASQRDAVWARVQTNLANTATITEPTLWDSLNMFFSGKWILFAAPLLSLFLVAIVLNQFYLNDTEIDPEKPNIEDTVAEYTPKFVPQIDAENNTISINDQELVSENISLKESYYVFLVLESNSTETKPITEVEVIQIETLTGNNMRVVYKVANQDLSSFLTEIKTDTTIIKEQYIPFSSLVKLQTLEEPLGTALQSGSSTLIFPTTPEEISHQDQFSIVEVIYLRS